MASQERLCGINLQYKLAFEGLKTTDVIASLYLLWDVYNCYKLWLRLSWERRSTVREPCWCSPGSRKHGLPQHRVSAHTVPFPRLQPQEVSRTVQNVLC